MNPSTRYENEHSRLLERFRHDADAQASKATRYASLLADARVASSDAETEFFNELSQDALTQFALAKRWENDVSLAVRAIENCGGVKELRARHLNKPAVFSAFAQGFAERATALEKLIPLARKRVSLRVAALIEQGTHVALAHNDQEVAVLRTHLARVEGELAVAVFGKTYSDRRGENYEPKSFDNLFEELTRPLPQPPAEPAA